ncbi:MAG: DUF4910 domain-containing protein [Phycisphaeraceae bacterium]|nr:DUF4910 domain-containing protein [Phycisphaerales bacterium]MCB9843147.1 DUF4910 domain-containing protein [Phycisphaeraceae bacterium]
MNQALMAVGVVLLSITPLFAQQEAFDRLTALEIALDAAYNADHAYGIVAEIDGLQRWPGNKPYQKAISIVERELRDAGYVPQSDATPDDRLVYRIEHLETNAWEPIDAVLQISGHDAPLLTFATNSNMIAINSMPTPEGGVEAELVSLIGVPRNEFHTMDLKGKIIMADIPPPSLAAIAIENGAIGVLSYAIPDYNKPEVHRDSIPHMGTSFGVPNAVWTLMLSNRARQTLLDELNRGPVTLRVAIKTERYTGDDQTIIAEVRGSTAPQERVVFSAHVQEPGANDNGSGIACQAEMARTTARLLAAGKITPQRTITFLWGNEIAAIARYLKEDEERTKNIIFGVSLDMVGQDTSKTGGTFLIEKLPDPSAIWTRGDDKHTEWGASMLRPDQMRPHYLNDYILGRAKRRASQNRPWVVSTNPYEGGSDHVPFLRYGVPAVLLWHFTDVYYHTDRDRIENVSRAEMKHVGVAALAAAISGASANTNDAMLYSGEVIMAAIQRMEAEIALSAAAIRAGEDPAEQRRIVEAWRDWYLEALKSIATMPVGGPDSELRAFIREKSEILRETYAKYSQELDAAEAERQDIEPGGTP